jgi:O-antigen/teichoic acid export membrane protein
VTTRPPLSQVRNGVALIAAKVITMGLGFVFWVLAARLYSPHDVGVAAGIVAAMMLCTQLALLGVGSAFITHFPGHKERPAGLLDTSLAFVTVLGVVWSAGFLLLAGGAFRQLDVAATDPVLALLFVAASVFGTVGILLDQIATALRRGEQALIRNVICALATVAMLAAAPVLGAVAGAKAIFLPWALAGLVATAVGVRQLRRAIPGYRPRAAADRRLAGELASAGLPNYALTLAERAPGLILPVLVAELLSPAANATWYAVWMMAWVVYIVPIQVGMTIFAEVAHEPGSFHASVRRGVLCSLAIGTFGALVLGAGGHLALSILGGPYAASGTGPLRVLLLAVLPLTFVQAHFSSCRARRALGEAIATGWVSAVASVTAATAFGVASGLMGMAVAWVAVQYATGAWSLYRLRILGHMAGAERPALHPEPGLGVPAIP